MIVSKQREPTMNGTCRICGRHNQELRMVVMWEYMDWTCKTCQEQMLRENIRKIKAATEHTEPAE